MILRLGDREPKVLKYKALSTVKHTTQGREKRKLWFLPNSEWQSLKGAPRRKLLVDRCVGQQSLSCTEASDGWLIEVALYIYI